MRLGKYAGIGPVHRSTGDGVWHWCGLSLGWERRKLNCSLSLTFDSWRVARNFSYTAYGYDRTTELGTQYHLEHRDFRIPFVLLSYTSRRRVD